jgi:hypothetical protein
VADQSQALTPPQRAQKKASFYATKPTRFTLFLRTFLPWQILRFIWINLKMVIIIRRSHASRS